MSSTKFRELAHKIAVRNRELFDTLLEFEKTKKIRTKTRLNFTVDKTVASRFKKFCNKHSYNMSAKIEQAMEKMIGKE